MRNSLIIAALFGVNFLAGCTDRPPTDQQMIQVFNRQRSTFDKLRSLACGTSKGYEIMMQPEWSRPKISEREKHSYYALLRTIGARGIQWTPTPKCIVWIEVWSVGLGGDGDYKKYRFGSPTGEPIQTVDSLEKNWRATDKIVFAQRELAGGWWLEFDHWP